MSNDIIIQKVPLHIWPLYKRHLYLHGRYIGSTFTYMAVIQEAPLPTVALLMFYIVFQNRVGIDTLASTLFSLVTVSTEQMGYRCKVNL